MGRTAGGDPGALWPLQDSGLALGDMGPTAGFEQRTEVVSLVHPGIALAAVWGRNTSSEAAARTQARGLQGSRVILESPGSPPVGGAWRNGRGVSERVGEPGVPHLGSEPFANPIAAMNPLPEKGACVCAHPRTQAHTCSHVHTSTHKSTHTHVYT